MDKLDEFLKKTEINLLPYQKEILRHTMNGENLYIPYPPFNRQYYFQILLSKGENYNDDH